MRIRVSHATTYAYRRPAEGVIQVLRQSPQDHDGQRIVSWRVEVDADGFLRERRDAFGNVIHHFYAEGPVETLTVRATGEAEVEDRAGVVRAAPEPLPPQVFLRQTPLTEPDAAIRELAQAVQGGDALGRLHDLMARLYGAMTFETGVSDAATPASAAFASARGVCQDYAHIFVGAARLIGAPARYVSGHLARRDDPEQEAAHAWAEAYVPDLGWVAFDAANGVCPDGAYLRMAVGLDYLDAAPIRGARRGGGEESLEVVVRAVDRTCQAQQQ
ncbi:transglutaminase family protein [Phenylobacterium sp.]|jgi:transglutaminase-like putative cysteine protease|uniref:transglutaminase family protein n=1 Tax=Phenylobacterium sp. TaxID=1871053 RepID=UPI002F93C7E2